MVLVVKVVLVVVVALPPIWDQHEKAADPGFGFRSLEVARPVPSRADSHRRNPKHRRRNRQDRRLSRAGQQA
ncbi:MAG: hypothetical protein CSA84_03220 [Actinomycetales bacterium]|nr:MAG: hypothetical protein CSA84_03220 [Actinomycetales bacterium]